MAPIPIVAGTIVRFSMQHTLADARVGDIIIDISLDEFAGSRSSAVDALVPKVVGQWQDDISAGTLASVTFTGARFLDIDSLSGHGGFQGPIAGKPLNGGTSAPAAPPNVCYLIHKQCVHNRQQRNGRLYMPGVIESGVDDGGVVLPAQQTNWNGHFNAFKSNVGSGLFFPPASTAWRVVHVTGHTGDPSPGFPNGKPNAWNSSDVDNCSTDSKVATQRRRLRG